MSSLATKVEQDLPRLSLKEREELEQKVTLCTKAAPGVEGQVVRVKTNFFEVKDFTVGDIIHYDVSIQPVVPPRLNRIIFDALLASHGSSELSGIILAYDGRYSAYSSSPLPKATHTLDVPLTEADADTASSRPPRLFKIVLKRVAAINMEPLRLFLKGNLNYTPYEAIQALEIVLRQASSASGLTNIARSFYSPRDSARLGGSVEAWLGFFQSLRPAPGRLLLNIDTSASSFYCSGNLYDVIAGMIESDPRGSFSSRGRGGSTFNVPASMSITRLSEPDRIRCERAIRGLKVQVTHRGNMRRKYRVVGLSKTPTSATFFESRDAKISVAEYFQKQYDIRLRYPELPCVQVGSAQRSVYLPIECCDLISGQRYIKKLNEEQTAAMIRVTCQRPDARHNRISKAPKELGLPSNPVLKAFGININTESTISVDARVLRPPKLFFDKNSQEPDAVPQDGAWNLRGKRLFKPATLNHWTVLNLSRSSQQEVEGFVMELVQTGLDMGMQISNKEPIVTCAPPNIGGIERLLHKAYEMPGGAAQLVLVILPTKDTATYGEVKRVTDCVIGRPSQCIVSRNVGRPNKQYCANVIIKMNVKLGGVTSSLGNQLTFMDKPTIVFGADVTHPGPGSTTRRSIASVVASLDPTLTQYATLVKVQESRQEVIVDLQEMVRAHLITFFQTTRAKPQRVVFFRDGLSEGQFAHCLNTEVAAIKRAFQQLETGYNPTLTFLVVQKRHHVKFFPTDERSADRSGNLRPGTVVDTTVTNPLYRDFFLMSHSGIQGTSRPAHYHVLVDENRMGADELEQMTYRMCYTYARCTRSVSYAPSAYYAHLAAFRARFHFKPDDGMSSASGGSAESFSGVFTPVHGELQKRMYYA